MTEVLNVPIVCFFFIFLIELNIREKSMSSTFWKQKSGEVYYETDPSKQLLQKILVSVLATTRVQAPIPHHLSNWKSKV